ncbi:MAG: flagellar basal body P-ring protein FlgI [Pirellulales bacterium]
MLSTRTGKYTLLFLLALGGCASLMERKSESEIRRDKIRKQLESPDRPTLVQQIATPRQLAPALIKNFALVTNLADTGGPVEASLQREKILDMLRRNEVPNPNEMIDSKQTAMVVVTSIIPPAAKAGEHFNVIVQLSKHAQATDLQQGWLREIPLLEIAQLEGRVRSSFDYAKAEGSIVTSAQYNGATDEKSKVEAVVVGGARLLKSRDVGIGIKSEMADAITMGVVVPAINSRFTYFDGSNQKGVAVPQSDEYIDLHLPARYKQDPYHFVNVVLRVGFNETADQKTKRIEKLSQDVSNPARVREACWQLEAIGEKGADILASQLGNPDEEIRFYCAHSLAYLGDKRAIQPLVDSAIQQAAFRAMALTALSSIDAYQAEEALKSLLHCPEPEARYGAVRTLRQRNPRDAMITAENVRGVGGLLEIPSSGPDMVAVSVHETPEVVFFGQVPMLQLPNFHNINPNILLQRTGPNEITITRFVPSESDLMIRCSPDLRSILLAITQVGGGYGDWVNFVRECQEKKFMNIPVAMNPVPSTGRVFDRETRSSINEVDPTDLEPASQETEVSSTWYKPWTWWQ